LKLQQVQASKTRTISFIPTIKGVRQLASNTVGEATFEVFKGSTSQGAAANATVDNGAGTYSVISCEVTGLATVGDDYRVQFDWRPSGAAGAPNSYRWDEHFMVVPVEYYPGVDIDTLRNFAPVIDQVLLKQAQHISDTKTAEQRAADVIEQAEDEFDLLIQQLINEDRTLNRAALVSNPKQFDDVIARISMALIFEAEQDFERMAAWYEKALMKFQKVPLIWDDVDGDGVKDEEIKAPDRDNKKGKSFVEL
jgi:hypothetical protein